MTPVQAHLICLGLVAADLLARAWRIQWIIRGLGHRISLWDSFVLNAFGDAACALTPLRIGGEPARLAGMLRSRVPAPAAFVAISLEVLAAWPVIIVAAGWLAWRYAPEWWDEAGPRLSTAAATAWPWVLAVVVLSLLAWRWARLKVASPAARQLRRPVRRAMVYWRRMPRWPLLASVPMSLINLATRVAILPVLALTLPSPPPIGPLAVGSFALLYSQLILPTPSGAGAVELGFLGGAAGDLGADEGWLLLAWRFYTNGIGVLLGVILAARVYGWPAVRQLAGRWSDPH
jgi:uncharacterized membrane protein YbhN (UPF0104 family)